jgi:hypothetical protein
MFWNEKDDFDYSNKSSGSKNETPKQSVDEIFMNTIDFNALWRDNKDNDLCKKINEEILSYQLIEEELSHEQDKNAFINKTDVKVFSHQTGDEQYPINDGINENILSIESLKQKYPSLNQNQIMCFETLLSSPSQSSFFEGNSLINSFANIILLDEAREFISNIEFEHSLLILLSSAHQIFPKSFFANLQNLHSIEICRSVKNLPYRCFYFCSSLSTIIFQGQIESIGHECFSHCSNLQSIEISRSVKNLPIQCFYGCSSLSTIIFQGQIESIDSGCFSECSKLQSIEIHHSK